MASPQTEKCLLENDFSVDWRASIIQQLNDRKMREEKPFEDLISFCCKLFDVCHIEKSNKVMERTDSGDDRHHILEKKVFELQEELTEMHRRKGEHIQDVIELKRAVENKEKERAELLDKLQEKELALMASKSACEALEQLIVDMESKHTLVKDEYDALSIAFNNLVRKHSALEKEHANLLARYKEIKEQEVDRINAENAKLLRKQEQTMQQRVVEEASKVTIDDSDIPSVVNPDRLCVVARLPDKVMYSFEAHDGEVNAVKWASSGLLATGGGDRKVKLWKISLTLASSVMQLTGSNASITAIDVENDYLLASSNDFASRVWTLSDGKLRRTLTGHSNKVLAVKFLGVPNKVVSGSHDRTLKVWDINRHACIRTLFAGSTCNDLVTREGQECSAVISGHFDKRIRFWDIRSDCSANEILLQGKITSLAVSPDGFSLLSCVRDDTLKLLDLRKNQIVRTYVAEGFKVGCDTTRAVFSPDNEYVAVGSSDGAIFIWNQSTGKVEKCLRDQHNCNVICCTWDPTGTHFVSCDRNKKVVIDALDAIGTNSLGHDEERNVLEELLGTPEDDDLASELNNEKKAGSKRKTVIYSTVQRKTDNLGKKNNSSVTQTKSVVKKKETSSDEKYSKTVNSSSKSRNRDGKLHSKSTKGSRSSSNHISTSEVAPKSPQIKSELKSKKEEESHKKPELKTVTGVANESESDASDASSADGSCSCEDHSSLQSGSYSGDSRSSCSRSATPVNEVEVKREKVVSPSHRRVKRSRSPRIDKKSELSQVLTINFQNLFSEKSKRHHSSTGRSTKQRDYSSLIKYFFKDTVYFVMKSNNHENVVLSKAKGVWSTPPQNEHKLNRAFLEFRNVILIFSIKESGKFQGFARLASESRHDSQPIQWVLPPGLSAKALGGVFNLDWICRRELSFSKTLHLFNPLNDGKPVKIARDGQEIEPRVGEELCRLFPPDENVDLIPFLKRMKKQSHNKPSHHRPAEFSRQVRIDRRRERVPSINAPFPNNNAPNIMLRIKRNRNGRSDSPSGKRLKRDFRDVRNDQKMGNIQRPFMRRDMGMSDTFNDFVRPPPMPHTFPHHIPFGEQPLFQRMDFMSKPRPMDKRA
ncbi:autophagy-related protein 16-like protein, partial [Leptotrombidium deliense]